MPSIDTYYVPDSTTQVFCISRCANSEEALRVVRAARRDDGRVNRLSWASIEVNGEEGILRAIDTNGTMVLTVDAVGLGYGTTGYNTAAMLWELAGRGNFVNYLTQVQEARWDATISFNI